MSEERANPSKRRLSPDDLLAEVKRLAEQNDLATLIIVKAGQNQTRIQWVNQGPGSALDCLAGARNVIKDAFDLQQGNIKIQVGSDIKISGHGELT